MALRFTESEQDKHDKVVKILKEHFRNQGFNVEANPSDEFNHSVDGEWPDLVFLDNDQNETRIAEVETEGSVDSVDQWTKYANLGLPFELWVPKHLCANVKNRLIGDGIPVTTLYGYENPQNNSLNYAECE